MSVMMQEEKSRDYLRPSWPVVDDTFVTQSDRTVIVDWLYLLLVFVHHSVLNRVPYYFKIGVLNLNSGYSSP